MPEKLLLGCVADDFTGGSDAASHLAAGGLNTILCNGVPAPGFVPPEGCEAVVIALKSRTQETESAVADSMKAARWLAEQGAEQLYVKYCSTFDSRPCGNIGPIVDAILEAFNVPGTILCPALPSNGRVVRDGILYVNGVPLAESPMKDHPLTPMWESRVAKLMEPQGKYACLEVFRDALHGDPETLLTGLARRISSQAHYYIVPDYVDEADAEKIISLFGGMRVLTGGSGLLTPLARRLKPRRHAEVFSSAAAGRALILSGSCSPATNAQTQWYLHHGGEGLRLQGSALLNGSETAGTLWARAGAFSSAPLIYAYETPEKLHAKRADGGQMLSAKIEQTLAETAALAVADGVTRIIVAGGETSGAVVRRLGFQAFGIGESLAPGVPVLLPLERPELRLILKSGNFGQRDFFFRALSATAGS